MDLTVPGRKGRSHMTTIAIVTGNPKPSSRTHGVALTVADLLDKELGAPSERVIVDLADHAPRLFDWADPALTEITAQAARAAIAIFASPPYQASYTAP